VRSSLRRVTLRTRLSILTAAAVGLTVAVAALVSFVVVRDQLDSQIRGQLSTDLQLAIPPGSDTLRAGYAASIVSHFRQDVLQIISPNGAVESPTPGGASPVPIPVTAADEAVARTPPGAPPVAVLSTRTVGGVTYRVETVGGELQEPDGTPLAIQVAHPITDVVHLLDELRLVLLLVALGGIAVAVAAGLTVARATIRPVERLTAAAEHVAATQDLDAAIDDDGRDELSRLAHAFNAMLAALRSSRRQQAQLVSDAGHELRTPLTSLRTNIEVLLTVERMAPEDRAELLGDVRGQLEELTTLIGDLVELGRQDETQAEPTEVRLDSIVAHAIERARRRAVGTTFDVRLDAGSVRAQPPLLERAVLNVLDNAVKFSPPHGVITVRLRRGDEWVLEVADQGPGIAPEDIVNVFDRFYRASTARSLPGSGLGLAIVAQVVTSHGGTVVAECPDSGGTIVRITLPTVTESDQPAESDRPAGWDQAVGSYQPGARDSVDVPGWTPTGMPEAPIPVTGAPPPLR
jgi:two-component system sensor histidine kinase MprB